MSQPAQEPERRVLRLERRARRRRANYRLVFFLVIMGLLAVLLAELGRTLLFSHDVGAFVSELGERAPDQIKSDLDRFAQSFKDYNPVIRRAAMTAFKVATGQPFGDDAEAWRDWWIENQQTWQPAAPADAAP